MGLVRDTPDKGANKIRKLKIGKALSLSASEARLTEMVTGVPPHDHRGLIRKINVGLPVKSIDIIQRSMHVAQKDLAKVLSISSTTLVRRKQAGQLFTQLESDRVVRLTRLWDSAVKLMEGDTEKARVWLQTPLEILGDYSPMDYAKTSVGAQDVKDLIGRIQHGVFS